MTEVPLVPGTVAEHTTCLLVKLGQVMFRIAENDLGVYELRVRHYSILQALADNGPMSQHALGGYLRIDPATMVTSLDDLETAALAARSKDPKDRRRYVVELTEHGQDIVREANSQLGGLDNAMFADLSPAEAKTLHRLLGKLSAGPTLAATYDTVRDQAGSRKMSKAS